MINLLITSGDGPEECRLAVAHIERVMAEDAQSLGVSIARSVTGPAGAPQSILVQLEGHGAGSLAASWVGTILWRCPSPLRPGHKRANWFAGVIRLQRPTAAGIRIPEAEVVFVSFRAGGPGGQHQNTTDSAVRATWGSMSAVSRDERSQHQNRRLALARLQALVDAEADQAAAAARQSANRQHHALARGNPVRVYEGREFRLR